MSFPKLQFIITTHSPHLIASAKANELLIIPEHDGTLQLQPSEKTYSGWNTDQILEELMGVKSLTNKTYAELIEKSLDLIEKNNIEDFRKVNNRIEKSDSFKWHNCFISWNKTSQLKTEKTVIKINKSKVIPAVLVSKESVWTTELLAEIKKHGRFLSYQNQ